LELILEVLENVMEAQMLLIFDLETGVLSDEVKESMKEVLRSSIERAITKHLEEEPAAKLVFSTVDPDPKMQDSTRCVVHRIRDNYILRGDTSLCKDLQKTIGTQAKVFETR